MLTTVMMKSFVFAAWTMILNCFFLLGEKVEQKLGQEGLKVITQLMGLILSVIGIQIGIEGIFGAISMFEQHHTI